jgi:broad specificity phosphatase PhoE
MNNQYYLVRHGLSIPNDKHRICSSLINGVNIDNGLTKEGINQLVSSATKLASMIGSKDKTLILFSPFSRTVQSASILLQHLGLSVTSCAVNMLLVERGFGKLENGSAKMYHNVWDKDSDGLDFGQDVETPQEVSYRISTLIQELENKYNNYSIILVTHGDVMMIARTYSLSVNPYLHRQYPYIDNGEIFSF